MIPDPEQRRLVSPIGWPIHFRAETVTPANRPPFLALNRYPLQVIGFGVRLPSEDVGGGRRRHKALSLLWAKPARWWK